MVLDKYKPHPQRILYTRLESVYEIESLTVPLGVDLQGAVLFVGLFYTQQDKADGRLGPVTGIQSHPITGLL